MSRAWPVEVPDYWWAKWPWTPRCRSRHRLGYRCELRRDHPLRWPHTVERGMDEPQWKEVWA